MLVLCKAGMFSFSSCVCGPKFSSKTIASEALSISLPMIGGGNLQMVSAEGAEIVSDILTRLDKMDAPNKSSVKIAHGAVVCDECELIGDITIGARTVIHPKARIIAEAGPVIIGEFNIIEELVHITNRFPEGEEEKKNSQVMIIGNNNVFEVGAQLDAVKVGDHNVVESKAYVGPQVELSSGCIIGAACHVTTGERLPENTVIYGAKCHRRVQRERPPAQNLQIDFLTKILPNYHYLKKVSSKAQSPQK